MNRPLTTMVIALAAALLLSACGCGADVATYTEAPQATNTPATATNEPVNTAPSQPDVTAPAPTEPVGIFYCAQSTTGSDTCPPSPTPLPAGRLPR